MTEQPRGGCPAGAIIMIAVFAALVPLGLQLFHTAPSAAILPPPPPAPPGLPSGIVADSHVDPWRVTNFINPLMSVDKGTSGAIDAVGGKALRIGVPEARIHLYDVSVYSLSVRPVHRGDRMAATIWLRMAPVAGNPQTGRVRVLIQESRQPYRVLSDIDADLSPAWTRFAIGAMANHDYPAGDIDVTAHLASAKQTVDIGQGQIAVQ